METPPTNLPDLLRRELYHQRLSQGALARKLGISGPRMSEFMTGKRKLTLDLAQRLYRVLKVDADLLMNLPD